MKKQSVSYNGKANVKIKAPKDAKVSLSNIPRNSKIKIKKA